MRVILQELMNDYARELVFVHIVSAVLWVGGMIILRLVVAPSLKNIKDDNIRQARSLEIMKKFFSIILWSSLSLLVTAIIFIIGLDMKNIGGQIYKIAMMKEVLWLVMFGVFVSAYLKRNKAQRFFVSGDTKSVKNCILFTEKLMLVNIILGLGAIYLGVVLRGY